MKPDSMNFARVRILSCYVHISKGKLVELVVAQETIPFWQYISITRIFFTYDEQEVSYLCFK